MYYFIFGLIALLLIKVCHASTLSQFVSAFNFGNLEYSHNWITNAIPFFWDSFAVSLFIILPMVCLIFSDLIYSRSNWFLFRFRRVWANVLASLISTCIVWFALFVLFAFIFNEVISLGYTNIEFNIENNIFVNYSKDGSEYEGNYRKGKKHGFGVYKWTGISNVAIESRKQAPSC